jgi:hypothetical protein
LQTGNGKIFAVCCGKGNQVNKKKIQAGLQYFTQDTETGFSVSIKDKGPDRGFPAGVNGQGIRKIATCSHGQWSHDHIVKFFPRELPEVQKNQTNDI